METTSGCTRIIFIFKSFVVKIPNFHYSWQHFLKGLLANIQENTCWKFNRFNQEKQELICPVIWCSWGGWLLVMKRADVKGYENWIRSLPDLPEGTDLREHNKMFYTKWIEAGFGGDDKADNYGYLNGKIVKVDYGQ